jgi:hypothetical protein
LIVAKTNGYSALSTPWTSMSAPDWFSIVPPTKLPLPASVMVPVFSRVPLRVALPVGPLVTVMYPVLVRAPAVAVI